MSKFEILIGADLVPTETNEDLFSLGDINSLLGEELVNKLKNADARIFNLETPLIKEKSPITKCGPALGAKVSTINGIKAINPTFLTLANNHIMDHGSNGLESTIEKLKENNIEYGGVGNNIQEAKKIWTKDINGIKLGIYSCAEHEFSIATETVPGANPYDALHSFDDVKESSNICDFLIVLYHGGKELYPYPSPNLQKVCRKFVESGADLVVCQHSHCIGCEETYQDKKIIYGQGNFLFDKSNRIEWQNGLLIDLKINKNHKIDDLQYIVLSKQNNAIRISNIEETKDVLDKFYNRSEEIKNKNFVKENYDKFSYSNMFSALRRFDLISNLFLFKVINKLSRYKFEKWYFEKIYLHITSLKIQNIVECEAWNEMIVAGLKKYNGKIKT